MPASRSNHRLLRASSLLAFAALFSACSAYRVDLAKAESFYQRGDYYQAYQAITKAREAAGEDPDVDRAYWQIRQGYLMAEAQRMVFANRELEALELIEKVLALHPDSRIAQRWKAKALDKLAQRSVHAGDLLLAENDLQGALFAYDRALGYDPGNQLAREGLDRLGATWSERQAEAHEHYIDGIRALGEHAYRRTDYHLGIALTKDPDLSEARDPADLAIRQLLAERMADARRMEASGAYAPAVRQYEEIAVASPGFPEVDERLALARRELEAMALADQGEIEVYRGNFAKGRELLTQAFELSSRQRDEIGERLLVARERETEHQYLAAKDLELQRRLDVAVDAFRTLEKDMPGYRDVRARIADLELRIEEAAKAYQAGIDAIADGDIDEAIDQLTDAQLFWPGYRDAQARLEALRLQRDAERGRQPEQPPDGGEAERGDGAAR